MKSVIIATLCAASVGVASISAQAADTTRTADAVPMTIVAVNGAGNTPNGSTPTGTVQFFVDGTSQTPPSANAAPNMLASQHYGRGTFAIRPESPSGTAPAIPTSADQKVKFGSLNGVDGMDKLFLNSRGGDQGNGGAVQSGRGYATLTVGGVSRNSADGAGGGGGGKVQMQDFHAATTGSTAHAGGGGAGKVSFQDLHFSTGVAKAGGANTGTADIITGAGPGAPGGHVKATDGTRATSGPLSGGSPQVKTYLAPSRR